MLKIVLGNFEIELKISEIIQYINKYKRFIIFGITVLFFPLILGDLFVFYELNFSINDYLNLIVNEYIYKSLTVFFLGIGIISLMIYLINYIITDTISNINFREINLKRRSVKYLYIKRIFIKSFKTIFLITSYFFSLIIILIFISSFELFRSLFLISLLLFLLNLFFISYIYKKLFEIDNNFKDIDNNIINSINSNNFFIIVGSIIVSLCILSFIFGFIGYFIKELLTIYIMIINIILLFFIFIFIVFNFLIELNILKNLQLKKNNVIDNSSKISKRFFLLFLLVSAYYFLLNTNTNSFINKIVNDKSTFIDFSINLMLNQGLIQRTNQPFEVLTKKSNDNLTLLTENITIPSNNDNYVSSYIEISKTQFLYFVRKRKTSIIDIYLISKEKEKYLLIKRERKEIN